MCVCVCVCVIKTEYKVPNINILLYPSIYLYITRLRG